MVAGPGTRDCFAGRSRTYREVELMINLKTIAETRSLMIPPSLLVRADRVSR